MQRLTATVEPVGNTLKIINRDKIEILATKMDYHKIILDTLKKRVPHIPTSATTCLKSGNQKSTPLSAAGVRERRNRKKGAQYLKPLEN
jgi:hypothetical protein